MSNQLDPEQRKKIEQEYRKGREAITIFVALTVIIIVTFILTLIFV